MKWKFLLHRRVPFLNSTIRCNITLITVWLDTVNPKKTDEARKKKVIGVTLRG
jgi:hypothetical protein